MLERLKEIQNNNSGKLDKFLHQIGDQINNVDVQLCENLEMDVETIHLNEDDCVKVYNYFIIFKMIAQISLNRIRNSDYYIQNTCKTHDLLKMIDNENDREIFNTKLNRLLNDKECKRELLLYEFKWSIKNYAVIYAILKSNENRRSKVPYRDTVVNLVKDKHLENGTGMIMARYGGDALLTKNPGIDVTYRDKFVNPEKDKPLENDNSTNQSKFWECPMCDSINYRTNSICEACEEKIPGLENQSLESGNEQILKDKLSQKPEMDKLTDLATNNDDTHDNADDQTFEKVHSSRDNDDNNNGQSESPMPEETKWTCPKCTYANVNTNDKCHACDSHGPSFNKWRCDQCTLINEKLAETCVACNASNPFLQKCSSCALSNVNEKYEKNCVNCASTSQPRENIRVMDVDVDEYQSIGKTWRCQNCLELNLDTWSHCHCCTFLYDTVCKCQKGAHTINKTFQDHSYAISKNEEGSKVFRKSIPTCLVCSNIVNGEKEKLCGECRYKYYFCSNPKCVFLNGNDVKFCSSCGVKNHSGLINCNLFECYKDGNIFQMWQCPFKECMEFNLVTAAACTSCACPKMHFSKYKCRSCGWIESYGRMCSQCETDCDPIS